MQRQRTHQKFSKLVSLPHCFNRSRVAKVRRGVLSACQLVQGATRGKAQKWEDQAFGGQGQMGCDDHIKKQLYCGGRFTFSGKSRISL